MGINMVYSLLGTAGSISSTVIRRPPPGQASTALAAVARRRGSKAVVPPSQVGRRRLARGDAKVGWRWLGGAHARPRPWRTSLHEPGLLGLLDPEV